MCPHPSRSAVSAVMVPRNMEIGGLVSGDAAWFSFVLDRVKGGNFWLNMGINGTKYIATLHAISYKN